VIFGYRGEKRTLYEIIKLKNSPRRRFIKRAARRMLFSEWITQILAFLIVGSCFIAINHFGTSTAFIVKELTDNLLLLEIILFFYVFFSTLFTVPLLYGLVQFEINAISGEKGNLTDLFTAFSDFKSIIRSYSMFLQCFGRLLLCFLPAIAAVVFNEYIYDNIFLGQYIFCGIDVAAFLCNTLFIILLYLGLVFFSASFVGVYLTVKRRDISVDECFHKARLYLRGNRQDISKTALSFIPLFVVSLFSIGFLFVLYTLPYMLITFLMTAKYICDKHDYTPEVENTSSHNFSE